MSALVTPEGYADLCTTTLTAGYTAASGSITVASTGAPFPQVQQFHFYIQDQTTLAVKAVGKATAITSGTAWAVTMSTDANCNSGDLVKLCLAADAMDQIRKDLIQFGTFASLPSTTGQKQGNRYKCTDAPFEYIFDGSNWQAYYRGFQATPITTANWSTLGSSGVRTDNAGTITVTGNASGASKIDGVSRTVPAGDFSHTFIVWPRTVFVGTAAVLVGFTDGTKTEGGGVDAATTSSLEQQQLKNTAISGGTVSAANEIASAFANVAISSCPLYMRARRSGTALLVDMSFDEGITYLNMFNDHTSPHLTASSLCVYIDSRTATIAAGFTLISSSLV